MNHSMISMTGFARTGLLFRETQYRLEVKSVNGRHLDVKWRLPKSWQSFETRIRKIAEQYIHRGSVEVSVERMKNSTTNPLEDPHEMLRLKWLQFNQFLATLDPHPPPPTFRDLLQYEPAEDSSSRGRDLDLISDDEFQELLVPAFQDLFQNLRNDRQKEGEVLRQKIIDTLTQINQQFQAIQSRIEAVRPEHIAKTQDRVIKSFQSIAYPEIISGPNAALIQTLLESRIAQEIQFTLDKADTKEETDRFATHMDKFQSQLIEGGTLGRKLEFMTQELFREINTLGNKAQDTLAQHIAVDIKVQLEQIREQSLNIE